MQNKNGTVSFYVQIEQMSIYEYMRNVIEQKKERRKQMQIHQIPSSNYDVNNFLRPLSTHRRALPYNTITIGALRRKSQ